MADISIREFLNGTFEQQHDAWYDWFCTDKALIKKTKTLVGLVRQIALSPKINIDKQYVWFKNNCPLYGDGKLYDDFRIADIDTGDVLYTIVPRDPHGNACVYDVKAYRAAGSGAQFNPIVSGKWDDVVKFFNAVD